VTAYSLPKVVFQISGIASVMAGIRLLLCSIVFILTIKDSFMAPSLDNHAPRGRERNCLCNFVFDNLFTQTRLVLRLSIVVLHCGSIAKALNMTAIAPT
jgi:hypothetical protein